MKELKSERMIEIKDMKEAKYSYKNLEAYKESKQLVMSIYATLKEFPKEEQYALCDQLRRAVIWCLQILPREVDELLLKIKRIFWKWLLAR